MDQSGWQEDLVDCPECGMVAEVVDWFWLPSTDGNVLHIRTTCVRRHHMTRIL